MAEEKIVFFSSLWRIFTFWKLRKSLGLIRAANRQFTGSAEGIRDAYDLEREKLIREYKELEGAVSEYGLVQDNRRTRLEQLNEEEKDLIKKREGALKKSEEAEVAGNQPEIVKHKDAFVRFHARILKIEEDQKTFSTEIDVGDQKMNGYLQKLTQWQAKIAQLPEEKAEEIAKYTTAKAEIALNDRISGLTSLTEGSALSLVREENQRLTAQAKVSSQVAGTDVKQQDAEYANAGLSKDSDDAFSKMMAARKAEREAKAGNNAAAVNKVDRCPEIS